MTPPQNLGGGNFIHWTSVKEDELEQVWEELHQHSGICKTWEKIRSKIFRTILNAWGRFYFYGGEKWVREKVKACVSCAHKNNKIWIPGSAPLQPIETDPRAMWRVHSDFLKIRDMHFELIYLGHFLRHRQETDLCSLPRMRLQSTRKDYVAIILTSYPNLMQIY